MKLVYYAVLVTIVASCCRGNGSLREDTFINNGTDRKCNDDLVQVFKALSSNLMSQMLHSNGKAFKNRRLISPVSFKDCISSPLDKDGHGNDPRRYCVTFWTMKQIGDYKNVPLTFGLCVSDSCSEDNIKTATKNTSLVLDRVPIMKLAMNRLTLDKVVCKPKERSLDAPSICYLSIISVIILFTILGSSLTVYDNWKINHSDRKRTIYNGTSSQIYGTLRESESSFNISNDSQYQVPTNKIHTRKKKDSEDDSALISSTGKEQSNIQPAVPIAKRILQCFSIFTNGQKILSTEQSEGQLQSIYGIRFLSLSWVILAHTFVYALPVTGNLLDALEDMDTFIHQIIFQGTFSVDSFFLLSGFLLTYLFLKEATKRDGQINWLYFYIHRIWRLTPPFMVVVLFNMLIYKYLGSGILWNDYFCDANRNSWWKYLFYINNFIPCRDMCVGWCWYLANDMQFYLISPLFLYPLWRWPRAGFSIIGCLLIVTWTTTGIISYAYDVTPFFFGIAQFKDVAAFEEKEFKNCDLIYDKPYCRIAPYCIGAVLGYVFYITGDRKSFLNWWQQLLGWTIATGCSFSVVFGLYHVELNRTLASFYNSLARSSFAIGLAWLIYACETGHGDFLRKFLSWKFWIPLSRLTYSAYLLHPILMDGFYTSHETLMHYTRFLPVVYYLAFLLASYVLAFLFSLVFESPFMNLQKLLIKTKSE